MNWLELSRKLRQETGTAGTGPTTTVGQTGEYKRLVDWINTAYAEIQNKWMDWRFLWAMGTPIPMVMGTRDYSLAGDCVMPNEDSFYFGTEKLHYVHYDTYRRDREAYDGMGSGPPEYFTIMPNETMRVFPTPAATSGSINYEYQRGGLQLDGDASLPVIPARYHMAIIYKAKMYWAEFENAQLELQSAAQNFNVWMLALEANQLPSREFAHGRIEGAEITVVPE